MKRKEWVIQSQDEAIVDLLSKKLNISPITSRVIYNRGYFDPDLAYEYITKTDSFFYDPFKMLGIEKAAVRIIEAINNKENITIYGDYDVDGVTSVALLMNYLKSKNTYATFYIPTREFEGYGINKNAIKTIKESGTNLIISVDCGIVSFEEVDYSNSLGMDIIITDHHSTLDTVPNACAVVNPHQFNCNYPFKDLAGVGVAFKLICAIELGLRNDYKNDYTIVKELCQKYLDLVALGTIADLVPMRDENRIIAYIGIEMMKTTHNKGIYHLLKQLDFKLGKDSGHKELSTTAISYNIAPIINASGRMDSANLPVQLLLNYDYDPTEADYLAEQIINTNKQRQVIESIVFEEANKIIQDNPEILSHKVIVVVKDNWNPGIIGIVASRILDKYGKPTIVLTNVDGICKGSARSIKGFNINNSFIYCKNILEKFGGHELAAGLTIKYDLIDDFIRKLDEYYENTVQTVLKNTFNIDCILQSEYATVELASEIINSIEPYGVGNPKPIFLLKNVRILDVKSINDTHTKFFIMDENGKKYSAIYFSFDYREEGIETNDLVDLVVELDINIFNNRKNLQLIIRDIEYSKSIIDKYNQIENEINSIINKDSILKFEHALTRNDLVLVYRFLQNDGKKIICLKSLASQLNISYISLKIIIEILKQESIISVEEIDLFKNKITLNKLDKKVNIFENELFKFVSNN